MTVSSLELELAPDQTLRDSFEHCRRVTRAEAGNFYYGLRLTPEPKRSALYAIYAWMRAADDIADDDLSAADKVERLAEFRRRTRECLQRGADDQPEPIWPALVDTTGRFSLDVAELEALLDGLEEDVRLDASANGAPPAPRYATLDALNEYCYRVASIVGITCLRIWGLRDGAEWDEARRLAIHRGRAFQLTNILRDVGRDHAEGRVYLPADHLAQHDLEPADLVRWADPGRCRACALDLVDRAREEYEESAPLDEMVHRDGAGAMWAMTEIYRSLLDRIAAEPEAVVRRRVSLPTIRKVLIGARAIARSRERGR